MNTLYIKIVNVSRHMYILFKEFEKKDVLSKNTNKKACEIDPQATIFIFKRALNPIVIILKREFHPWPF